MAVDPALLWQLLPKIGKNNAKGEYYLTDLPGLVVDQGSKLAFRECPETEVLGVNNRVQLAAIETAFQHRLRQEAMLNGATLVALETVFLSVDTKLGQDVVVEPNVVFGTGVTVADRARIRSFCHIERSTIGEAAIVGPFARLRPGAALERDVHIGNFVEIKQAVIGPGAKINHLAYVGDARGGGCRQRRGPAPSPATTMASRRVSPRSEPAPSSGPMPRWWRRCGWGRAPMWRPAASSPKTSIRMPCILSAVNRRS